MAVTLQLIESIFGGLVHPTTGAQLASCKARFYDVGTLTPQTVYSDSTAATPITQPLTLTAAGQGVVYTANPCRCIVKDSTDVTTIYDVAVINGSIPAGQFVTSTAWNGGTQTTLQTILDAYDDAWGGSAGYWKYKHANGTTERTPRSVIGGLSMSPQDFGALGDGATDDTAAFAALATAQVSNGLAVYIPAGTYQLSALVSFSATNAIIRGSGPYLTKLRGTNGTMDCIGLGTGTLLSDVTVTHSATSTGKAVKALGSGMYLENVITDGTYATAFAYNGSSASYHGAINCFAWGSTNATTGNWAAWPTLVNWSGTTGAAFGLIAKNASNQMFTYTTADMANGGTTTPIVDVVGSVIHHLRVRGTSAGGGTIDVPTGNSPSQTKILILELYNNSGGAYTFTLNAAFKNAGNPAPANGSRVTAAFVYNSTETCWTEVGRATST